MIAARLSIIPVVLGLALAPALAASKNHDAAQLRGELLDGKESATQVLTRWCADRHLAAPAVIRAERDAISREPSAETRTLLAAKPGEPIRYRRVKLVCGSHVLSEADNWYVPGRLTAEMNRMLDTSDTPFGAVVKPLNFHRVTLDAEIAPEPKMPLRVRALLLTPDETPFSLVIENYKDALTAPQ